MQVVREIEILILSFIVLLTVNLNAANTFESWKELKPIKGVSVLSMAKHPNGRLFASTLYNGIYASDDKGKKWKQVHYFRTSLILESFPSIAVDSTGIIYAAAYTEGLYCSTDNGDNWYKLDFPASSENIGSVNTDKDGRVYVTTGYGLYLSDDKGKTWNKILDTYDKVNDSHLTVRAVCIKDGIVYATVDYAGLYISEDFGKNWEFSRLPWSAYPSIVVKNRKEIIVSLNIVISGVYRTVNGGINWKDVSAGLTTNQISCLKLTDDGEVLAGGKYGRIFKSRDNFETWDVCLNGETIGNINSIVTEDENIVVGTSGSGVLIGDLNYKWKFANEGFPNQKIRGIIKHSNGDVLIATASGIYKYDPKLNEYIGCNNFLDENISTIMGSSPGTEFDNIVELSDKTLLANTYQGTLWRSTNIGNSWNLIKTGFDQQQIFSFKLLGKDIFFYAGSGDVGIYRSSNNGLTWDRITKELGGYCYVISTNKVNTLFASIMMMLKSSKDSGKTWDFIYGFESYINDFIVLDSGEILVVTNGYLYRSVDNGLSFARRGFRNEVTTFLSSLHHIYRISNGLILTTERGLYISMDKGESWKKNDDELQYIDVNKLCLQADGSMFALTENGVYYTLHGIITDIENKNDGLPSEYSLSQNYPNPFNPSTTIRYQIPVVDALSAAEVHVTLKVYDLLGREVATLVDEFKQPGIYNSQFSIVNSQFPSGIYFYRLQAGNPSSGSGQVYSETKKMILMK